MWMNGPQTEQMTPWEVIEGALARKKPQRSQDWLAEQLGTTAQAVSNWKDRGVPKGRYEQLSEILGLTMEQVAGKAPVPWERPGGEWPFPDIDPARFARLTDSQRWEIQLRARELIEKFESERQQPGKLSGEGSNARENRRAG